MEANAKHEVRQFQIDDLTELQVRAAIRPEVVDDLVQLIEQGQWIDPIVVFVDKRSTPPTTYVADGHHRIHAFRKLGRSEISGIERRGSLFAAAVFGVQANSAHLGERFSRADKVHAVQFFLKGWFKSSDRSLGKMLNVDHRTVGRQREKMVARGEIPSSQSREGLDGKVYTFTPAEAPPASATTEPTNSSIKAAALAHTSTNPANIVDEVVRFESDSLSLDHIADTESVSSLDVEGADGERSDSINMVTKPSQSHASAFQSEKGVHRPPQALSPPSTSEAAPNKSVGDEPESTAAPEVSTSADEAVAKSVPTPEQVFRGDRLSSRRPAKTYSQLAREAQEDFGRFAKLIDDLKNSTGDHEDYENCRKLIRQLSHVLNEWAVRLRRQEKQAA